MPRNRPLLYTGFNSATQFVLGMVTAQKGPSFNDLILISDTDVEGGSFYVTASNFGYMLGSLLAGAIFGRIKTRAMTIAIGMMLSGLLTCLVPQCTIFPTMLFMQALVSVFSSVYETTVSADEIEAWDGNSESVMQFLSFCYSIGGVISPLITRPFMAPKVNHNKTDIGNTIPSPTERISSITKDVSFVLYNDSSKVNVTSDVLCPGMSSHCMDSLGNNLAYNLSANEHSSNQTLESDDVTSNIQYAYLITGVASILLSIPFYFFCVRSISRKAPETREEKKSLAVKREIPKATSIKLVALVGAFYFFHAMGLDSFGQYLFFFLVTHLDWSKENAAYLMSLYWALAIPVKLIMAVMYKKVKVGTVLLLCNSGIFIFVTLFIFAGHFRIDALVWISCSGVAVSQASIYGGGFSWTDGNVIPLDGKVTSLLMVFTCLGALTSPLLLGVLMKHLSLMSFPYCVLVEVSISVIIFLVIKYVVVPFMDRTYGPLRPKSRTEHINNQADTDEDAQEAMVVQSKDGGGTRKDTLETVECVT